MILFFSHYICVVQIVIFMESFIEKFGHLSKPQLLGWIFFCLALAWIIESGIPLIKFTYNKWRHDGVNLFFLSTTLIVNGIFGAMTAFVFVWLDEHGFGLLHWVGLPFWVELLLAVMILDLIAQYWVHYLLHKVKWMWKFHLVHHSDTLVDASTGTRHHPGDYLIREIFGLLAVVIAGIPFAFYIFYKVVTVLFTYMTHANFKTPNWVDKTLGYVFITPNMHKFHHHYERPWTDTNFGNIFSIWDRIFGTLVVDDTSKIRYGVDVLSDHTSNDVMYQLKVPFDPNIKTDY